MSNTLHNLFGSRSPTHPPVKKIPDGGRLRLLDLAPLESEIRGQEVSQSLAPGFRTGEHDEDIGISFLAQSVRVFSMTLTWPSVSPL